jgi:hypothetical protein
MGKKKRGYTLKDFRRTSIFIQAAEIVLLVIYRLIVFSLSFLSFCENAMCKKPAEYEVAGGKTKSESESESESKSQRREMET